jgi:hypothetical protein
LPRHTSREAEPIDIVVSIHLLHWNNADHRDFHADLSLRDSNAQAVR